MGKKQRKPLRPVTIIQSNGEKKDFQSVSAAARFCYVNPPTIQYALSRGKNKFTKREDKVSFQVFDKSNPKPKLSKMPRGFKKQYAFPDSWSGKDKDEYFDMQNTEDDKIRLRKFVNFLRKKENDFEDPFSSFSLDPFRTDPPGFSNS